MTISCSFCSTIYDDCFLLFDHIASSHLSENNFQCLFYNCRRVYSQIKSFQKHFTKKHVLKLSLLNISVLNNEQDNLIDRELNKEQDISLIESTYDVTKDNTLNLSFSDSDDESIIYEENVTEPANDMSLIDKSPQKYKNIVHDAWLKFTASLYSKKNIPREYTDFIVKKTDDLLLTVLATVKENVCSSITNLSAEVLDNINVLFFDISTCSSNFNSEQKRFTQYETLKTFVRPESYNIGERIEYKRKK